MVWTDVDMMEVHLQIISDALISDGKMGNDYIKTLEQ